MSDRYQVSLFTCPATIPFSVSVHSWFVCSKNQEVSRWEILWRQNQCKTSWSHLHRNFLESRKGIEILPFSEKFYWFGKLIGQIQGDENSLAKKMIDFIEKSKDDYPYRNQYSIFGPNSNTYTEWIIDHFKDSQLKLPWNSFGKYYNYNNK